MVVVVRRGPAVRRPVATGLVVGGAVARNQHRRNEEERQREELAEAKARASRAEIAALAATEEAKRKANETVVASAAVVASVQASVVVPPGVSSGQVFSVIFEGRRFNIACPTGVVSGQTIIASFPAPPSTVPVAQVQPLPAPACAEPFSYEPSAPPSKEAEELETSQSPVPPAIQL